MKGEKGMKGNLWKVMMGMVSISIISLLLLSAVSFGILNGMLPGENNNVICCLIHFIAVYLGSLFCFRFTKEKKGGYAGISVALWYALLLFVSVVILAFDAGNLVGTLCAGVCAYGVALLTYTLMSRRGKTRRPRYRSR